MSILRAKGEDDEHHSTLRLRSVQHIVHNWDRFKNFANHSHQDAPAFANLLDYATYMSKTGTWASDVEAQAAAEILGHPLLIWTMNTGRHGFLYNYSDSSRFKQTLHIVHSTNHFDALVVNNPLLNLQYTQQLAQCSSSGNQASPIHINSDLDMRMTEIVKPACHQKHPQTHSSQAIGKTKLPSFITQKNTTAKC
jgi:hypothetical protein